MGKVPARDSWLASIADTINRQYRWSIEAYYDQYMDEYRPSANEHGHEKLSLIRQTHTLEINPEATEKERLEFRRLLEFYSKKRPIPIQVTRECLLLILIRGESGNRSCEMVFEKYSLFNRTSEAPATAQTSQPRPQSQPQPPTQPPPQPQPQPQPTSHQVVVSKGVLDSFTNTHENWVFGGIAELVDNARDAMAKNINVKFDTINKMHMLVVHDDGTGMDDERVRRLLSMGHEKDDVAAAAAAAGQQRRTNIGAYGIGFKTGVLCVGHDALILTRCRETTSVALYGYSYVGEDSSSLETPHYTLLNSNKEPDPRAQSKEEYDYIRRKIFRASGTTAMPFNETTIGEFIAKHFSGTNEDGTPKTGTLIFIYNLKTAKTARVGDPARPKLTLNDKMDDIIIPTKFILKYHKDGQEKPKDVPMDWSLRAYLRVLYWDYLRGGNEAMGAALLTKNVEISVMDKPVKRVNWSQTLKNRQLYSESGLDFARPLRGGGGGGGGEALTPAEAQGRFAVHIGFVPEEKENRNCGVMMYHRGRLIRAYERPPGCLRTNDMHGVVVVCRVDFLSVQNSKQEFTEGDQHEKTQEHIVRCAQRYLDEILDENNVARERTADMGEAELWVQCENTDCKKWRKDLGAEFQEGGSFCCYMIDELERICPGNACKAVRYTRSGEDVDHYDDEMDVLIQAKKHRDKKKERSGGGGGGGGGGAGNNNNNNNDNNNNKRRAEAAADADADTHRPRARMGTGSAFFTNILGGGGGGASGSGGGGAAGVYASQANASEEQRKLASQLRKKKLDEMAAEAQAKRRG